MVLVDEAADTGEHAARRRRPDRLPGGLRIWARPPRRGRRAHAGRAFPRQQRGGPRRAPRGARPRASRRRDAGTSPSRRRARPRPGRPPDGPPRQRRRTSPPAWPTSSSPTSCGASSTRSSPGTAAPTACAGRWTWRPARPARHRAHLPAGRQVAAPARRSPPAASPTSSGSTSTGSTSARSSPSTSARPRRRSRRSSTRSRRATALLLFDEADALFGRRSEVKDAHDRYANIEVGYLLQRLESYDGIAVLTTNLQGNMDAAFVRRLRFILHFPAPDRELRRRLWERSLPGAAVARRRPRARRAGRPLPAHRRRDPQHRARGRAPRRRHAVRAGHHGARRARDPARAAEDGPPGGRGRVRAARRPTSTATATAAADEARAAQDRPASPSRLGGDLRARRGRGDPARRARAARPPAGGRAARPRRGRPATRAGAASSSAPSRPDQLAGPGAAARLADDLYRQIARTSATRPSSQVPARAPSSPTSPRGDPDQQRVIPFRFNPESLARTVDRRGRPDAAPGPRARRPATPTRTRSRPAPTRPCGALKESFTVQIRLDFADRERGGQQPRPSEFGVAPEIAAHRGPALPGRDRRRRELGRHARPCAPAAPAPDGAVRLGDASASCRCGSRR